MGDAPDKCNWENCRHKGGYEQACYNKCYEIRDPKVEPDILSFDHLIKLLLRNCDLDALFRPFHYGFLLIVFQNSSRINYLNQWEHETLEDCCKQNCENKIIVNHKISNWVVRLSVIGRENHQGYDACREYFDNHQVYR